ncbi:MAG TPA: UDP-N-acetylmuramoyl-tripeptide--D-alanyl-D-alanine ligase [Puia sp.]|jgi:UDP-N-acetylmuramoyl-tripeptide--D-alanyl-D-alanine ligase|nr:UDP-N-acetylmuramoyl-tripeptide--D-alanyl-D-alanine ligase [Puia sp.]
MTIENLYEIYLRYPSIQTDTRQLRPGDLFFALKGPNFNGNRFAARALELGAAYVIADEVVGEPTEQSPGQPSPRIILVPDVLQTLQDLALHHRKQFNIPIIAITGSNGKTTTKELIHAVLSSTFITYTTKGNLNNHIGIPLTILSIRPDAQLAVIEMGANHQKEIEGYCQYTLPTHGIITNIGKAHLEGFGGPEGVRKGKGELYDFLRAHDGTAFVLTDSPDLPEMSRGIPHVITYGTHDADVIGHVLPTLDSFLHVGITHGAATGAIHTQLVGEYNLPNVLVAVAAGKNFGVPDDRIRQAIEAYTPSNSRSQLIEKGGLHIILDAYNANPSSMRAAIDNFARMPVSGFDQPITPQQSLAQKVLILGAMAELGPESLAEHAGIVQLIAHYHGWQHVVLVGGDFQKIGHPFIGLDSSAEAAAWLRNANLKDSYLLIKGSRSMRMEEVLI